MSLSVGIVGFPNVGKSTLFNALLKKQAALSANYPFATIEPNVGIVEIEDKRLQVLAKVVNTSVIKKSTVEFIDIAGLVEGASKGEGLGNQFLSHIRETDLICHCLRGFSDESVIREGAKNPQSDLEIIRMELQLADLSTLEKQKPKKGKVSDDDKKRWIMIEKFKNQLAQSKSINELNFESEEEEKLAWLVAKELNLLTSKPEIFVLNVDEDDLNKKKELIEKWNLDSEKVILISAKFENELASLNYQDQVEFLESVGLKESGLNRLAKLAYQTLNLQSFLTAGEKEVKAWTIKKGMTAPQAAGVIHTDFEKNFIKANVCSYQDFIDLGGWKNVKEKGKMRLEGKDYVMKEGDVVEFMIGK